MEKLSDVIKYLELGTKLHIGVLFFGNYGNELCELPFSHQMHSSPFCTRAKAETKHGYRRCFACRNLAIEKALRTKLPFGGECINGIYEYVRPVLVKGEVAAVIFIGNIQSERGISDPTLEKNFTEEDCEKVGNIMENHILLLLRHSPTGKKPTSPLVENIKNYILSNIEFDINISYISKIFHYNEMYLGRLFKRETGESVSDYITLRRLEIAKELLSSTNEKIINIASTVGFNSVTYFNRVFKKHTGICPSDFRRAENK